MQIAHVLFLLIYIITLLYFRTIIVNFMHLYINHHYVHYSL